MTACRGILFSYIRCVLNSGFTTAINWDVLIRDRSGFPVCSIGINTKQSQRFALSYYFFDKNDLGYIQRTLHTVNMN